MSPDLNSLETSCKYRGFMKKFWNIPSCTAMSGPQSKNM